jgi:hypothetical protein
MTSWIAASLQTLSNYFGKDEDEEEALEIGVLATTGNSRKKRKAAATTSHHREDTHKDDTESKTRFSARVKSQKKGPVAPSTAKLTNMKGGVPDSKVFATRNADTTAVESRQRQTEDQQL